MKETKSSAGSYSVRRKRKNVRIYSIPWFVHCCLTFQPAYLAKSSTYVSRTYFREPIISQGFLKELHMKKNPRLHKKFNRVVYAVQIDKG